MTPEQAAALRAPFAPELVGKLPRIWCGACRDARGKVCSEHSKTKCDDCQNKITTAHLHLDYVGHADVTDRLLQVDPAWTWEPVGTDPHGLPALDANGGLWLRLTVCGASRLGYGHADGKRGGDAIKEAIGDGIRNAALRFGVAIDLWRKEKPAVDDGGSAPTARPASRRAPSRSGTKDASGTNVSPKTAAEAEPIRPQQRTAIQAGFSELGYGGDANRDARLQVAARLAGLETLGSTNDLTAAQARQVLDGLAERRRAQKENAGG